MLLEAKGLFCWPNSCMHKIKIVNRQTYHKKSRIYSHKNTLFMSNYKNCLQLSPKTRQCMIGGDLLKVSYACDMFDCFRDCFIGWQTIQSERMGNPLKYNRRYLGFSWLDICLVISLIQFRRSRTMPKKRYKSLESASRFLRWSKCIWRLRQALTTSISCCCISRAFSPLYETISLAASSWIDWT